MKPKPIIKPVQQFSTIAEGIALSGYAPFYVPEVAQNDFAGISPEFVLGVVKDAAESVSGYDIEGKYVNVHGKTIVEEFISGELRVNVVNSSLLALRDALPKPTINTKQVHSISPILTAKAAISWLHMDTPEEGGGWMFLTSGEKKWIFVDPAFLSEIYERSKCDLIQLSDEQLLEHVSFNALSICELKAGGFLYFPPGWPHQVTTTMPSIGAGGYGMLECDRTYAEYYRALTDKDGEMPYL